MVETLLARLDVKNKEEQLFNCDEVGMKLDPQIKSVFARRGSKDVSVVVPTEGKEQYTVLVCGSAAGKFLPPFVIVCIGGVFLLANVRYCILPKY